MIGSRLKDLQATNPPEEPNAYLTWIDNYVADDYTQAVRTGRGMVDVGAFGSFDDVQMLIFCCDSVDREACGASVAETH
jgi:thiaminase